MDDVIADDEVTTARWKATIYYRSGFGLIDVEHGIEEIEDLQDIVERGPDWNAIDKIVITLDRKAYDGLTIEEAAGQ
jgi:hypothetical protein